MRGATREGQVLFLSQPMVGAELSRFAARLAARDDFPHRVVYRLHPYRRRAGGGATRGCGTAGSRFRTVSG